MLQRIASLLRMGLPITDDEGLLFASGATVPTGGTNGYQVGAIFQHTDGGAGTALYVNEGSVTSSTFNALAGGAGGTTLDSLTDITASLSYTAGALLVADGDSYEEVAVSGDATLASTGALTIAALAVETAMLAAGAVTTGKVVGIASGKVLVGVDGTAGGNTTVSLSGDVTMSNAGVVTIAAGAVEDSMIEGLANGALIVGSDGTAGGNAKVTVTGDITMDSSGVTTIGANTVTPTMIENMTNGKIIIGVTATPNIAAVLSGDVTMDATGDVTIGVGVVEDSMFEGLAAGEILIGVDGTAANNLITTISGPFNMDGTGLISVDSATVAAAGTVIGDGGQMADGFTLVSGADGTKGVNLPTAAAGGLCIVKNNAAAILKIWPMDAASDAIDALGADNAYSVAAYTAVVFVAYDATTWYSSGFAFPGVTAGTALASQVVVLDSSKDIAGLNDVGALNLDLGLSAGGAGSLDIYPTGGTLGKLAITASDSAGDTTTAITNASQGGARTYTIPDAGESANFVMSEGAATIDGIKTFSVMPVIPSATVAATGTVQGDAAAITTGFTLVSAADGAKGVQLPAAVAGLVAIVKNNVAAVLKVWPNTDDAINGLGANNSMSLANSVSAMFVSYNGVNWYTLPLLPS